MEDAALIQILDKLRLKDPVSSLELSQDLKQSHDAIIGQINSLKSRGEVIEVENVPVTNWELTDEGKWIVENGSYEVLVFNYVKEKKEAPLAEIMKTVQNAKIGFSKAMANNWVKKAPGNVITLAVDAVKDEVRENLECIKAKNHQKISDEKKSEFKKRKLIKETSMTIFNVKKGKEFNSGLSKQETELTAEMIESGSWKNLQFKNYNFEAMGVPPVPGALHPLMKVRDEFRKIFIEMGFSEMDTKSYVENSFWNFDALFQPQQHPARDAHDTFFLDFPKESDLSKVPVDYVKTVKEVHSKGKFGSRGYNYDWSIDEAKKNILRTHTTANSARFLYALAQNEFKPVKMFSIDKVFRNETLDATHLAEFHQVEGLIADYNLTLGDLIGVIHSFFGKLGITELEFKPAYNPYTEPSMEIFCFHPGLSKWIEVGNSGMFRPEMLLPMGLPSGVNVIAWGLSLERPAMIKYQFNNIRDLVGPKVQLSMIQENPICRLEK